MRLLERNRLRDIHYVEPFAGGAAIALELLFCEYASTVHINDLSRPVYAFWHTALHGNAELCRRIKRARMDMTEWRAQRAVYERRETAALNDLGFAALFLNRTNRSGIIGGGVIGGKKQAGTWRLDARFNTEELVRRIRRIGRYRGRILLYASSAESVGEFWFGQVAKRVIQSDFQCPGGAEPIRPFGDHSGLSVEAFDNATGELPPGSEPVQNQVAVRAQPCGQPPSSGRAASASSGCTSGRGTGRPSTATRSPTAIESPP